MGNKVRIEASMALGPNNEYALMDGTLPGNTYKEDLDAFKNLLKEFDYFIIGYATNKICGNMKWLKELKERAYVWVYQESDGDSQYYAHELTQFRKGEKVLLLGGKSVYVDFADFVTKWHITRVPEKYMKKDIEKIGVMYMPEVGKAKNAKT